MARQTEKGRKGTYGGVRLPVAKEYVFPRSMARSLKVGGIGGIVFVVLYAGFTFLGPRNLVSGGPLSSSHATIENDCAKCHAPFRSTSTELCSVCHEKFQDPIGTYSMARHYLYESDDLGRVQNAADRRHRIKEPCGTCHTEHRGRNTTITEVSDPNCLGCHAYGSLNGNHPEFDFLANKVPDDSTLIFTHIRHVRFVLERIGTANTEKACLYCHTPRPDGRSFEPIQYEPHCGDCHLKATASTPTLPLADPADPSRPGVLTLETIRQGGGSPAWRTRIVNPADFNVNPARGTVKKTRLVHADPWILENLARLRRMTCATTPLGDLLDTDGMASNESVRDLGRDAVRSLREAMAPLENRPEPEVRAEYLAMNSSLRNVESLLRRPGTAGLSADVFARKPIPGSGMGGPVDALAASMTKECRVCHMVRNASIARVQKDQRAFLRASFDHRAHILDSSCLDCHTMVPFNRYMKADSALTAAAELARFPAAIQNLPGIENCRACHAPGRVSNECLTCHLFHPDKTNRSNLLLSAN